MGTPLYISFATKNTPYIDVLEKGLVPSLKQFNLSHCISHIEGRGNWWLNTQLKTQFIYDMLTVHKRPVVFLDADAKVVQQPVIFDNLQDYDLAFHNLDFHLFWHGKRGNKKREPLTGTLYVNYTEQSLSLLNIWIEENKKHPERTDMENFQTALSLCPNLKIFQLPIEYVAIVGRDKITPYHIRNPIIIQYQVSRTLRRKVT